MNVKYDYEFIIYDILKLLEMSWLIKEKAYNLDLEISTLIS